MKRKKIHNIGRPKVEINEHLADRLKELRGEKSRQKFIDDIGLTQIKNPKEPMSVEQYRQFENKTRNVPQQVISKVCNYFDITECELLGIPEPDAINQEAELYAELNAEYEIWSLIQYLKRLGYEIKNISDDLTISLKKDDITYTVLYSELKRIEKEIEKYINDSFSK